MALPTLIRKRDGHWAPFEPEKISRSLFAITEQTGAPDAFLARELTDGVLHFLSLEPEGAPISVGQVAEMVVKVVRELGYPAIARAYQAEFANAEKAAAPVPRAPKPPQPTLLVERRPAEAALREFSLKYIYARDIASAHQDGLLHLMDLDHPGQIAGSVWPLSGPLPVAGRGLMESLSEAKSLAGQFLAIDSPDLILAEANFDNGNATEEFVQTLDSCVQLLGIRFLLNLNITEAPPWQTAPNLAPLFPNRAPAVDNQRLQRIAEQILELSSKHLVLWHCSEYELQEENTHRLEIPARAAFKRENVEFVFDAPKRPVQLGPGVDRACVAVFGIVGVNMPHFVKHLGGTRPSSPAYLKKLESLARFAKSAGHGRQDFLRKYGPEGLQHGFMLERAVQLIVPMGTIEASTEMAEFEREPARALEIACMTLAALRQALMADRPRVMGTRVDFCPAAQSDGLKLFCANINAASQQMKMGAQLLNAGGGGGLTICLNKRGWASVENMKDLLRLAYKSGVNRVRFLQADA